jgi:EAL domain-containing protein (putative c-di-GMP-specific phosphodiesterase class I)
MDYILSPCSLAAAGLARMMTKGRIQPVILSSDAPVILTGTSIRRIVVFLPEDPFWLLTTLHQAAILLARAAAPLPMLILSRSPTTWLWSTLLHQVDDRRRLSAVRAIPSDLPNHCIASLLGDHILQHYPRLEELSNEEAQLRRKMPGGLSKQEFSATLDLLRGYSVITQAKRRGINHKTLYNQRTAGLKKMVEYHPQLATRFPGSRAKGQKIQPDAALSAFEHEFVHAIHCRQIFPVFQPITDGRMQLKGIEILSRWRKNGHVLLPGDFLPQVRSEYAWLVLTAFLLREAVQNINQHPGDFYFSVNIPAAITGHENLPRMIATARQQLRQPHTFCRLVLEFSETTNLNNQSKITENITNLRKQGFTVMLDNCFSQSCVMFSARTVWFNAYKLDKSIVDDMQRDPHALALIKSLLYYCQLTGSRCIAEGVDSLDNLNKLKALGVDYFQGYLISPPVEWENIDALIRQRLSGRALTLIAG